MQLALRSKIWLVESQDVIEFYIKKHFYKRVIWKMNLTLMTSKLLKIRAQCNLLKNVQRVGLGFSFLLWNFLLSGIEFQKCFSECRKKERFLTLLGYSLIFKATLKKKSLSLFSMITVLSSIWLIKTMKIWKDSMMFGQTF